MKKTNFLKIAFTLVLAFLITGVFAQLADPAGFYTSTGTELTTSVTIEKTMPFFVDADDYFNPSWAVNYTAAATNVLKHNYVSTLPNADILSAFTWVIYLQGDATKTPIVATPATGNYVTVAFTAANGFAAGSTYILETQETNSSCTGPLQTVAITVNAVPAMSWTTAASQEGCTPVNSAVIASLTGDATDGDINLFWTYSATNVDGDWDRAFPVLAGFNPTVVTGSEAPVVTDYDFATGTPQAFAASGAQTLLAARDWTALNNEVTIYEFTLESVTDKVSRRSDYLAVYNLTLTDGTIYTPYGTPATIRIIVNPAPVTGPVYHISNTWGL